MYIVAITAIVAVSARQLVGREMPHDQSRALRSLEGCVSSCLNPWQRTTLNSKIHCLVAATVLLEGKFVFPSNP